MKTLLITIGIIMCLCSFTFAADWYPGIIHLHTQFSDGVLSPTDLAEVTKANGAKFIIVTDHYDMIGNSIKGGTALSAALGILTKNPSSATPVPWGFERYYDAITGLCKSGEFIAIPGAEIGSKWYPEPENEASSHVLALGEIKELDSQLMDEYCEKFDTQQDVLNKIRQWDMLSVAAHPSFLHNGKSGKLNYLGRIDYRFDKRPLSSLPDADGNRTGGQYNGLTGVELFDVDNADQNDEDIDFYLRLLREGYQPFVVAGSDYHGVGDEALQRKTWVYADDLTTPEILNAIKAGKTYAAQNGAHITSMSPMPGEHINVNAATIKVTVEFPKPTGSTKTFLIYKDGKKVPSSEKTKASGATSYDYEWIDLEADGKEHSYVLRVSEVLVTSPVYIKTIIIESKKIIYYRKNELFIASLDGKINMSLTKIDDEINNGYISLDGKTIYISSGPWGHHTLSSVDINSGNKRLIATGSSFALSPDESLLAISKSNNAYIVDLKTGQERPLLQSKKYFTREYGPEIAGWSRDGKVVFLHGDNGTDASETVFAVETNSGRVLWLTGGRYWGTTAESNALIIAQEYRPEGGKDYFIYEYPLISGLPRQKLTDNLKTEHEPALSPDGHKIAFILNSSRDQWSPTQLCVFDINTQKYNTIMISSDDQSTLSNLKWSNDGAWLLFTIKTKTADDKNQTSTWLVSWDGREVRRLLDDSIPLCWMLTSTTK